MPHLRFDHLQDRWIIFAPDRIHRPAGYNAPPKPKPAGQCPFCPGNEKLTPPEITALRPYNSLPDKPGWQIRVIPNKFPALTKTEDPNCSQDDLFLSIDGYGCHEVIIESPRHDQDFRQFELEHIENILAVYKERMKVLMNDPHIEYILIFRNQGYNAGVTQYHPHAQLLASTVIPKTVRTEFDSSLKHQRQSGKCLFCSILDQEIQNGQRVIHQNEHFAAYLPYASRMPYEICVMPKKHQSSFTSTAEPEIHSLAKILKITLKSLTATIPDIDYNLLIHTAPNLPPGKLTDWDKCYHWHIEIIPRIGNTAGFEIGTGFFINTVLPETAAKDIRSAIENVK